MTGFNTWDIGDKVAFWSTNLPAIIAGSIGLVINPLNWNYDTWLTTFLQSANSMGVALDSENYYDYVASMLSVNDSELTDIMYNTSVQYIKEETGWFTLKTVPYAEISALNFDTQTDYDALISHLNSLDVDAVVAIYTLVQDLTDYGASGSGDSCRYYAFSNSDALINYNSSSPNSWLNFYAYNSNWELISDYYSIFNFSTRTVTTDNVIKVNNGYLRHWLPGTSGYQKTCLFTKSGREIRIYNSLDDFKMYSVGERPYYVTEKFMNYDSSIDNSTTITQTEIDNSVTYGDIYNYIINNYENPDGLSEDKLRAILEEYLSQIGSGSGGGSGSGDDDDDDGGGLSALIKGIGKIFDALLSVIGVLLEYIGKALELLTGTMTKIIDLVPSTITAILGAIFSFFPQEWMTAIELALVLGVVISIVGLFRK